MDWKALGKLRQVRFGAQSGAGVAALAVMLVFANLIGQRFFFRLDLTEGRRYSLSQASRRLVRSLPDRVNFRAYVSDGLPQPHAGSAQYLRDLLGEYRAAARGKVSVESWNPDASDEARADARKAGVQPVRFTQVSSDRFQIREGYLGLVLFYQDKQEVIPFVKDPGELEYEITSRLRKMARASKRSLAFVTGHGETSVEDLQRSEGSRLHDVFRVAPYALDASTPPARPDVLVVANPGQPFKDNELDALDALISAGVPTVFFVSQKTVGLDNFGVYPRQTGLEGLLAHYGARVEEPVILDAQCQQVQMQSRQNGFTVSNILNYPAFVLARPEPHPASQSLDALMFPFANAVTPTGDGARFTPLAASSAHSWAPLDARSVDPYGLKPPQGDDLRGPFTLAALVEGSTVSFRDPSRAAQYRLMVSGTGSFIDGSLPIPPDNGAFLSQLAEWMAEGDGFSPIPTHGGGFRPLRPLPAAARGLVKLAGYFLLPALSVFAGVFLWRRRGKRRPGIQKEWEDASRA